MKKGLLLCIILLLVSCAGNHVVFKVGRLVELIDVPLERTLSPVDSINGPYLDGITGIHCVVDDSILVFRLSYDINYNFRAFNLNDSSYLDFMARGRGPGEALTGYFSAKRKENGKVYLDVSALNEGLLMSIDLEETLKEGVSIVAESNDLLSGAFVSFLIADKILSEVCYDEDKYSLKLYNKIDGKVIKSVQIYGNEDYLIDYQPLFGSPMMIKPDGTKLSLPMVWFDELNLFDVNGRNHLSVTTAKDKVKDDDIIRDAIQRQNLGSHLYYYGQDVTDDSIFAVYLNCDKSIFHDLSSSTVQVFSWDGIIKSIYHFDEPLFDIAVSDDGKTLYGLTLEEKIYCYNLE